MHPIFEVVDGQPRGWALTDRTPLKDRHLAANPHVACFYWSPAQNTVAIDCTAEWVEDDEVLRQVWDIFAAPEPPGWGDLSGYGEAGIHHPRFHVLRLCRTASRSCGLNSSQPETSRHGRGDGTSERQASETAAGSRPTRRTSPSTTRSVGGHPRARATLADAVMLGLDVRQ